MTELRARGDSDYEVWKDGEKIGRVCFVRPRSGRRMGWRAYDAEGRQLQEDQGQSGPPYGAKVVQNSIPEPNRRSAVRLVEVYAEVQAERKARRRRRGKR